MEKLERRKRWRLRDNRGNAWAEEKDGGGEKIESGGEGGRDADGVIRVEEWGR